jgi:hypothetical protein
VAGRLDDSETTHEVPHASTFRVRALIRVAALEDEDAIGAGHVLRAVAVVLLDLAWNNSGQGGGGKGKEDGETHDGLGVRWGADLARPKR